MIEGSTSGRPAALITEFLFSSAGVVVPPTPWLQEMRGLCDELGMLMIADEAQTGLGRTGEWFAFNHSGVVPDVVVVSKTIGGGVPLSAVIVSRKVAEVLESNGFAYGSSHSGDPLLAAAGLATIDILQKQNLLENVRQMGAYLKGELLKLKERYEIVGDVRGLGLKLGMEIVESKATRKPFGKATRMFTTYCRDRGLILGNNPEASGNIIRILPGFTLTRDQVDFAVRVMDESLAQTTRELGLPAPTPQPDLATAAV
jgi:2,2-dialkylglycine decarboxylase (pyruvate)